MSEESKPWWKRAWVWAAAGVSAVVLAVLANLRKQNSTPPTIVVPPPTPVLPPVTLPTTTPTPADDYAKNKVVPNGTPDKAKVSRILLRLQAKDNDPKKG